VSDLFDITGRVALVTGASRGLGRDMAAALSEHGATVLCAGRAEKDLQATVRAITRKGGKAEAVVLDVDNEPHVKETVATLARRHKRIDILVNNAGITHRQAAIDTATADWERVIRTDLTAPFMLSREVAKVMRRRRHGRIVNIASVLGLLGRVTVPGYVAAKHGLIGLTRTLAAEFGPEITVNAIAPGYIRTDFNMVLQNSAEFNQMIETRTAARRWGHPKELRGALLLLASDAGAFITGETIVVDGGLTAILG
jgi:NAD(P)-dependent dehydrogenase (short-subunit alcohol dehydrogenase family)